MSALRLRISAGPALVLAAVAANVVLWIVARPPGQPTKRYLGELLGAEAVLLFSLTLLLASLLPGLERAFSGLDRIAVWHRRTAVAGVLLLLPHDALASSTPDRFAHGIGPGLGSFALVGLLVLSVWALAPKLRAAAWPGPVRRLARATYERWLTAHRLTGLFVIAAVVHGGLVAPSLHASTVLRVAFLAVGGTGIAAYAYRELVARFVIPVYDYTVADVRRPNASTIEISLEPVGTPLAFRAGQFVFLAFGGAMGWQRHPFSVASAPRARRLEVAVKAVGDYTRDLRESLRPGTPARVVGPYGAFDYRTGGRRQLWIAGGIGITPFLSWIRGLDDAFDRDVDFYYSVVQETDALYVDEIAAAAARHPTLRPHLVVTQRDGLLTADRTVDGDAPSDLWIYLCGPPTMTDALARGYRGLGIPPTHIRWEAFDIR
jgi:predicted ferric reductase